MRQRLPFIVAAFLVLVVRIASAPRSPWELDEILFTEAVVDFNPLLHHPHPPGYPLLIGLGKIIALVVRDPYFSLVTLSILASAVSFFALAKAFALIADDRRAGIAGSLLVHLSPALLVHGPLALSDPAALMFLSLMLLAAARIESTPTLRDALLLGTFASAAIGCRPQYAVPIVPVFLVLALRIRLRGGRGPGDDGKKARSNGMGLSALAAFTVTSLIWLTPLVIAVGGPMEWVTYELRQASYVAQHDAVISRSGWTAADLALRFVAHPWGPKWLSLPLIAASMAGAFLFARRARIWPLMPLVGVAGIQLLFCFASADPADGVRYVLPSIYAAGFFAALLLARLGRASWLATAAVCAAFVVYAYPVIAPRVSSASPPARAAAHIRTAYPRGTVVLFESSLRPHAAWFLREFERMPVERAMQIYASSPEVALVIYADGASREEGAAQFAWPESDAYGKLTRNHYRVVSVAGLEPDERFRILRGVHALERDPLGTEWRWMEENAQIELPDLAARAIEVGLRLPPEYPREAVDVSVEVAGVAREVSVRRGETVRMSFADAPGKTNIGFACHGAIIPARIEGSLNRDPRSLCVQLAGVEQH
jgi:hypothetical protein